MVGLERFSKKVSGFVSKVRGCGLLLLMATVFPHLCFGGGLYGQIGVRICGIEEAKTSDFALYDNGRQRVYPAPSQLILGFGYRLSLDSQGKSPKHFLSSSLTWDWTPYQFDRAGLGHEPGLFDLAAASSKFHMNISGDYTYRFGDSLELVFGASYVSTGVKGDYYEAVYESEDYIAYRVGLSVSTRPRSKHWVFRATKTLGRRFINAEGPAYDGIQLDLEIPPGIATIGLLAGLATKVVADNPGLLQGGTSGHASDCKWKHVYGKIRIVEYGEDFKVQQCKLGEDLCVKLVDSGATRIGLWQIVEYGEDFKIRLVKYNPDFKIRVVPYGEGCP